MKSISDRFRDRLLGIRALLVAPRSFSAKLVIENATEVSRIVWLEPWAEDYTLLPRQKLEIIVRCVSGTPYFHVDEHADSTQVWIEGQTNDYDVLQEGRKIDCGHQRQAALDAGLTL